MAIPTEPTHDCASLPSDTNFENPILRASPRDNNVPIRLPLCDKTANRPRRKLSALNAALVVQINPFSVFATPIELGPIIIISAASALATNLA